MSLMNVRVSPDRVLVSVDTLASVATVHPQHGGVLRKMAVSKMIALPHLPLLVAVNGDGLVLTNLIAMLHSSAEDVDIEWLAERLAPQLDAMVDQILPSVMPGWQFVPTAILIAGKSPSGMKAYLASRRLGESKFSCQPCGEVTMPGFDWTDAPVDAVDDASFAKLAGLQVERTRREHPEMAIGGRMLLAEITASGTVIRDVCELG